MPTPSRLSLLILVAASPACARNYYGSASAWTHSSTTSSSAQSATRVYLESRQGPVHFAASDSGKIDVRLRIGHARGAMGVSRDCKVGDNPPIATITRAEQTLHIRTDRSLPEDCVAEWTVALPSNIAVETKIVAGTITTDGLAGGLTATAGSGDIRVRAAGGPVNARTDVGAVDVEYSANNYGNVSAETNVGSIQLSVNGRQLSHNRAPGSGDTIRLDGAATNAIRITVNVGSIAIRVGSAP